MDGYGEFLEAAKAAAREAGGLLRENADKRGEIMFKGAVDLVTHFDRKSQEMIFRRLSAAFPGHGYLAEEGLSLPGTSDCRWIIDPIDGTTNFAHTFPVFCVSIALEQKGEVVVGAVYDPMRDELFEAARGRGAFLNGARIRVSDIPELGKALLATGFPYDVRTSRFNNVREFNAFIVRAQAVRRCGSAALDLCYVACGRFDGFWELKLKPWDVAAGALIVEEAGGRVSDFEGRPFDPFNQRTLATNGLIHEEMKKALEECGDDDR
ncbi:MAG: inositol monophosphatase [Candidatus Aminicenantes bacterium]|nr:inositol monophosphatase [Candidatus Aminicenantes bacterium]